MELVECPKCGEEYPAQWKDCPFCAATPHRDRPNGDEWN